MKTSFTKYFAAALVAALFSFGTVWAQTPWATAYYAGWQQGYNNTGYLPAQNVDYSAVTDIIHFAVVPQSDGTLDDQSNSVTAFNANALVTAAHAAGKKVLICVGGWNSDAGFEGATNSATLNTFVSNLINLMKTRGYDGIDIDWEPMNSIPQWKSLITALRTAMNSISPRPLLTTANGGEADQYVDVIPQLDQLNYMSYDMSGAWPGWVTWHNSPIFDGGVTFPSTGGAVPSTDATVQRLINAGVPKSKIGVGIDFYGYVWSGGAGTPTGGVTAPDQAYTTAPSVQSNVPYSTIMDTYYQSQYDKWDAPAQAAYLSIDNSGSANDKFISYDNETTVAAKFNYIRSKGLGGAIIWELGGGYRANQPVGSRDKLLQAVKAALGVTTTADVTPPTVAITSPANGASLTGLTVLAATATASDNVGVAGVQFKLDGTNAGAEITAAPFAASLNIALLTAGTHTISAVARDAAGNTSTASVNVSVILSTSDVTPPTVSFTSPAANATVSGTVTVSANASDNVGVAGVQFTVDGTNMGSELTAAPYTTSLNTASYSNASHIIAAVARDAAGNKTTASVTVTVSNTTPPPSGGGTATTAVYEESLALPWTDNSWSATVTYGSTDKAFAGTTSIKTVLTAAWGAFSIHYGTWGSAGVTTSSYTTLDFEVNGATSGTNLSVFFENDKGQSFPSVSVGTIAANAWTSVSIPMSKLNPNNYTVNRVDVQDVSGSVKTFYIDNLELTGSSTSAPSSGDTQKPTVSVTSPANGATVSGTATVAANASDNVGVVGVQFRVDGANVGSEITQSPYSVAWNTTQSSNGSHTVTAVARDAAGNRDSSIVTVSVSNAASSSPDLWVSQDGLQAPWIDASWSSTVTFSSTDQQYAGSTSIKVVQNAWGAFRLHSGPWGNPAHVNPSAYQSFQFAVNGGPSGVSLGIYFENDNGQSFPSVSYVWVGANQWQVFTYPMSQLNPNNQSIDRFVIQDLTGRQKTFYVDNIRFIAAPQAGIVAKATDVAGEVDAPTSFGLGQNFPNPFNPTTLIAYDLPQQAHMTITVYNMLGQRVATLVDRVENTGRYAVPFDGARLASGVYLYRLEARSLDNGKALFTATRKMILTK